MIADRRKFLKNAAQLSALSLYPASLFAEEKIIPSSERTIDFSLASLEDETFWEHVRQQFPISNTNRIYLNNGTMGPSPYPVIEAIHQKMLLIDSTCDYGGWEESRKILATFVHAAEDEICLTHNVTEGVNIICWGLDLKKGDEILVTNHEHVGGALPWLNRARIQKLAVNYFQLGKTADETLANLEKKITKKTKVIAVPHVVCTIGQVQPIKEIVAFARERNIRVFVDGAHGAGMLNLDLHELGCDYYATCCHKWLCGPKGTGFLYIRKEALETIRPYFIGSGSDTGWDVVDLPSPAIKGFVSAAHRFDYGTQSAASWKGVNEAVKFFDALTMPLVESRVKYLATTMQQGLLNIKSNNLEMLTSTEDKSRAGLVAFKLKNVDYAAFQTEAINANFKVRKVPENGVNCIRVSTHIYNTMDEIKKFVSFVDEMSKKG